LLSPYATLWLAFTIMLATAGGLLLSRQTLSAARFLCRMRIAKSSARRFNPASGVNRKNSKSRLLISSSPVWFAPSNFVLDQRRQFFLRSIRIDVCGVLGSRRFVRAARLVISHIDSKNLEITYENI
jgi:hypothetical protein